VIKAEDVPEFHLEAWEDITFETWNTNPVGFEMTADVIFVATFLGDTLSSVRFCSVDRLSGEPMNAFPGGYYGQPEVTLSFEKGHILTAEDLPIFGFAPGTIEMFDGWEPNPVGVSVTDGLTFTVYFVQGYEVWFTSQIAHIFDRQLIKHGLDAVPPELPEIEGYLCLGWDKPYTHIVESVEIFGIYWQYGDVNMDSALNTGDAGMLLNYAAKLSTLDEMQMRLGDYNKDGAVNVGDAAAILAFIVGVN
ncbi:MAG: dockerin type I repeat-containing protein, partial [Clostridia bacterium]